MSDEKYFVGELINLEGDLFDRTKLLFDELSADSISKINMIDFRCSEIYSLRNKLDLFLKIQNELQHYQLSSLISFWDGLFHEMKEIIREDDSNTSWMSSQYDNYQGQHETVEKILRDYHQSLKD